MADSVHIRIDDPGDPWGPPAYEGPADKASGVIKPGTYTVYDEEGRPATLVVHADGTSTLGG